MDLDNTKIQFTKWLYSNQLIKSAIEYASIIDMLHIFEFMNEDLETLPQNMYRTAEYDEFKEWYYKYDKQSPEILDRIIQEKYRAKYSKTTPDWFKKNGSAIRAYLRFLYYLVADSSYPRREQYLLEVKEKFFVDIGIDNKKYNLKLNEFYINGSEKPLYQEGLNTLFLSDGSSYLAKCKVSYDVDGEVYCINVQKKITNNLEGILYYGCFIPDLSTVDHMEKIISLEKLLHVFQISAPQPRDNKNEYIDVLNEIKNIETELDLAAVYHFTDYSNLKSVIDNGTILSRKKVSNICNILDGASKSVLSNSEFAHYFSRFYFRPSTPTLFNNEGVKRKSVIDPDTGLVKKDGVSHLPRPVYLVLKKDIIWDKNSYFSKGGLNKKRSEFCVGWSPSFLKDMQWSDILSNSARGMEQRKSEIIANRHSELIYLGNPDLLEYLEEIVFRSIVDYKQALVDFKDSPFKKFLNPNPIEEYFSDFRRKQSREETANNYLVDFKFENNRIYYKMKRQLSDSEYSLKFKVRNKEGDTEEIDPDKFSLGTDVYDKGYLIIELNGIEMVRINLNSKEELEIWSE